MATAKRRHDPDRKDRIIEATLEVIAVHGVSGTTHRRVAEAADVPLGSMTYHFAGIDDLVQQAFSKLTAEIAVQFDAVLGNARTVDDARETVVGIICDGFLNDRHTTLALELYAYVARVPDARRLTTDWMAECRKALERHFTPEIAIGLDALIEGASLHNYMNPGLVGADAVRSMVARLTT
ncbi:TetR/AcrR family transcriptional regulator [Pararhizobium qamdonense]|uniref:TetR/AcrR family transcriptional regulator n=1 Tax=Pararhizobium qamdonense TaxID=3031126 RepID=UPI0023E139BB|nr:TetR family transcriptional regulator [Pararhizobium qamdonense]